MTRLTTVIRVAWLAYAVLLAVGLVLFARPSPPAPTESYGSGPEPGGARTNLALLERGARVVVSSANLDYGRSHHPLFLIDGRDHPTRKEKWASLSFDEHPFVEVRLADRYDVDEVRLVHAGAFEAHAMTIRRYEIICLAGGERIASTRIARNHIDRTSHPVDCPATDTVRIELEIEPETDRSVARLYEVEVWGR